MKNKKLFILWTLTFLTGVVVGGACAELMHRPCPTQRRCHNRFSSRRSPVEQTLPIANLQEGSLPQDVQEVAETDMLKSSAELPSQLVRAQLPDDILLGVHVDAPQETDKPVGVILSDGQNTVVLNSQKPAQRVADGSSITMIEAPVSVKRIKTLDAYKEFKKVARGSYPTADFAKEEVVVLESASNLPDKVFEIVSIEPAGENVKLQYRVNVFGLDKKTNTHSAQKISKTKLPIVLEQVL